MNSFRVGTIGVMVEYWGTAAAEGFLHDFQGWAVFIASAAVLMAEMVLLARIGGSRQSWREVLGVEFPAPTPAHAPRLRRVLPTSFAAAILLMLIGGGALAAVPERPAQIPDRKPFSLFPRIVESWSGRSAVLDELYVDALLVDDYIVVDYVRPEEKSINLYVAWYDVQRAGQSAHSPRSCIPAGGWQITSFEQRPIEGVDIGGRPLRVNRVLVEYDDQKQLVYYWFQQRGRIITNEYLAKWYLLLDSLRLNRTDGALVRLITPISPEQDVALADERLTEFVASIAPRVPEFVPN
jgi:exosortase D (VPLPA-CTERM-specific)